MTPRIENARQLMRAAHTGQKRRDGTPYYTHPLAVTQILTHEIGVTEEDAVVASLLHDVIEDTSTTLAELESQFGPKVASLVRALTKPEMPGEPNAKWAATLRYFASLKNADTLARQIKIADRIHNIRDMVTADRGFQERYIKETPFLIAALQGTPGIEKLVAEFERAEQNVYQLLLEGSL